MSEPIHISFKEHESIDDLWKGLKEQFIKIDQAIERSQMFLSLGSAEPEVGDHLVAPRYGNIYTHHGIYIGDFTVLHYAGASGTGEDQSVQEVSLDAFAGGSGFIVTHHYDAAFKAEEVVERAKSRLGENRYNFLFNNCEHFANWCITDQPESEQVGHFDIFKNGNRLKYQSLMQIGKLAGRGACVFVSSLVNAGEKILKAEEKAQSARIRSNNKLKEAEEKWIESELARSEIRSQIKAQMKQHFNELNAIQHNIEEGLSKDGDIDELNQSIDAFLEKIGSNTKNPTFSEFKENFGFG